MEAENTAYSEQAFSQQTGASPAQPEKRKISRFRKFTRVLMALLLVGLIVGIYFKYFFVFGEGVKSGLLNYAVKKGNIFKTYEGKLIQEGIRSRTAGAIQSYEFEFSVKSKKVFDTLAANSGKRFELHYKEYHGTLPWRGNTKYIVDSIVAMRDE